MVQVDDGAGKDGIEGKKGIGLDGFGAKLSEANLMSTE